MLPSSASASAINPTTNDDCGDTGELVPFRRWGQSKTSGHLSCLLALLLRFYWRRALATRPPSMGGAGSARSVVWTRRTASRTQIPRSLRNWPRRHAGQGALITFLPVTAVYSRVATDMVCALTIDDLTAQPLINGIPHTSPRVAKCDTQAKVTALERDRRNETVEGAADRSPRQDANASHPEPRSRSASRRLFFAHDELAPCSIDELARRSGAR